MTDSCSLAAAIGVDPAKGAGKKPAGAVQKRRKPPVKTVRAARAPKAAAVGGGMPAAPHEMDHYAAEALLALGEVAWEELRWVCWPAKEWLSALYACAVSMGWN